VEITYLIRIEEKTIWGGDFGSKLTINHPSSVDKKRKGQRLEFEESGERKKRRKKTRT